MAWAAPEGGDSLGECEGLPLLACLRCGAYAISKAQGLAATCPGRRSATGRKNLLAILEGRHPQDPRRQGRRLESLWAVGERREVPSLELEAQLRERAATRQDQVDDRLDGNPRAAEPGPGSAIAQLRERILAKERLRRRQAAP